MKITAYVAKRILLKMAYSNYIMHNNMHQCYKTQNAVTHFFVDDVIDSDFDLLLSLVVVFISVILNQFTNLQTSSLVSDDAN